jgi:GH15 family glucan-1,4-alpha-glucosidase
LSNGRSLEDLSLEVIRSGQSPSGAYIAAPSFPTYRFSWFRDGAFIAHAMQLAGEDESARRFHQWAIDVVRKETPQAEAAIERAKVDLPPEAGAYLRARYPADGALTDDPWPNFQLDGLGSWLWSLNAFASERPVSLPGMMEAVETVATYLSELWRTPCFDCWEENGDQVHISTLAAIHGGLVAAGSLLGSSQWFDQAAAVREFALERGTLDGRFRKHLGTDLLDASLLWVSTPFRMVEPDHPVMRRTVDELTRLLKGPNGGIRRYPGDSYYGGGEWILLTAHLGWYWAEVGELDRGQHASSWVEAAADERGHLAEQLIDGAQHPDRIREWMESWGPVANPLLWSHASYLILRHALRE